jgi:hypothetical protein
LVDGVVHFLTLLEQTIRVDRGVIEEALVEVALFGGVWLLFLRHWHVCVGLLVGVFVFLVVLNEDLREVSEGEQAPVVLFVLDHLRCLFLFEVAFLLVVLC